MSNSLLPNEKIAVNFINKIGIERAKKILGLISARFDRRYKKACSNSFSTVDRGSIRVTPIEAELSHRLRIGLMLCDTENTPEAARQRNLERRAKRKAEKMML